MLVSSISFITLVALMSKTRITALAQVSSTESSAEYLYNVMNQLQEHNRPSPVSADRTTGPAADFNYFINNAQSSLNLGQPDPEVQQTEQTTHPEHHRYFDSRKQRLPTEHLAPLHNDQQFAESNTAYYQVPAPQTFLKPVQVLQEPAPLGLTRSDLATLYKKALQQGSPVSLSTLTNPLSPSQLPQITGNQLRLNSGPPGFYYYFYPLKSFMNELTVNHGQYNAVPQNIRPQHSDLTAQSSEKQMANPLFTAISGFIGMAIVFMLSVLFLPRFDSLGSRNTSDEFLQLTKVAWEAIEGRNCTERFACELNKVALKLELSKRSRRLLENVVPTNLRKPMIKMRKSTKKPDCKLIMCKCAQS